MRECLFHPHRVRLKYIMCCTLFGRFWLDNDAVSVTTNDVKYIHSFWHHPVMVELPSQLLANMVCLIVPSFSSLLERWISILASRGESKMTLAS